MGRKEDEEARKLERAVALIDEQDDLLRDKDQDLLKGFHQKLLEENKRDADRNDERIAVLLDSMRLIAKNTDTLAESLNDDTGEAAVDRALDYATNDARFSGNTILTRTSALRVYGGLMTPGEGMPERFARIKPDSYRENDPTPIRSEIVEWVDILKVLDACEWVRDKAMIAVQWSAMTRPQSELHPLKFKHVTDNGDHMILSVPSNTKTGRRDVYIYAGAPFLRKWMDEKHPAHKECENGPTADTPLWTHLTENTQLVYAAFSTTVKKRAKESSLTKKFTPAHLRRSRASVLASRPTISEQDLRVHGGWSFNSAAPRHYIADFSKETAKNIALADGADIEGFDERDPIAPIECAECGRYTTRHLDECLTCNSELPDVDDEMETIAYNPDEGNADLLDLILGGEIDADDLRALQKMEPVLRNRPDIFDDLDEMITLAERYNDDEDGAAPATMQTTPVGAATTVSKLAGKAVAKTVALKDSAMRLSPDYSNYPPSPQLAAGLVLALGAWAGVGYALLASNGMLGQLLAGDAQTVTAVVIALAGAVLLAHHEFLDVEEL